MTTTAAEELAEKKKQKRAAAIERGATLVTAAIASAVAAQGMYVFFHDKLHMPGVLLVMSFSFIELMVVTSAMRARRSQIDTGSAGVDGIAMWVLTVMSGVLAATHADGFGVLLLRLLAPMIAAWGWERSMKLERRQITGRASQINWRWSPTRLLVRWGIADPTDRTTAEVAVDRRLADLARAADAVRLARDTGRSGRRERQMIGRLHRAIDKATDDGLVLGEPDIRRRLRAHLEGRFSAYTLPEYVPVTNWSAPLAEDPFTPDRGPGGGADIDDELDRIITAATVRTSALGDQSADPALGAGRADSTESAPEVQGPHQSALTDPGLSAPLAPAPASADSAAPAPAVRTSPAPEVSAPVRTASANPAPATREDSGPATDSAAVPSHPASVTGSDVRSEEVRTESAPAADPVPAADPAIPAAPVSAGSDLSEAAEGTDPAAAVRGPHSRPAAPALRGPHFRPAQSAPASAGSALSSAPTASARTSRAATAPASADPGARVRALAEQVQGGGVGQRLGTDVVSRVIAMAQAGETANAIHEDTGVHHKTIKRIRDKADELTTQASGGQIISLRSRS